LADWRDTVRNSHCTLCPLHEGAQHVCLLGAGDVSRKLDIMIVGEAPGAREDESHEAFVGPAGKLLTRVLSEVGGIDRDQCYITNVVKCRPPNNATPDRKEIKICVEAYLDQEIERVNPKFVLLLGNSALQGVVRQSGITKKHGTVYKRDGRVIMATLHPALILRNPKWASAFAMDIQRLGRMVRGEETSPTTEVKIIRTKRHLHWLMHELKHADVISWDIETSTVPADPPFVRTNFQEWWGDLSRIASISFSWRTGLSAVLPVVHAQSPWGEAAMDVLRLLTPLLTRPDCKYVGHSGKFDARWMQAKGIPVPQTFDTMLAAHMLDENRPKGLKPLSRTILGADAYDVGEELKDAYSMPLRRLCIYNGKDTDYTLRLYHEFRKQLIVEPRVARVFAKLMMPASEALVDIERTGVWIDPDRWQKRHDEAQERVKILYDYIDKFVPEHLSPINLNSPQQVARWLYGHLELPLIESTKTGNPSTREGVLLRLEDKHPGVKAVLKYRKWANKYLSTYLLPLWFEHRDDNGRVHSNYKLFGTVTGRLSGEGGIQQIPRDPFIRSLLGAPPGWTFLQADYSQVELRIVAMLANERRMMRQYLTGEDIHMSRAMKMTRKIRAEDVTKEERKKAKAVNFGYVYGMGAKKFVVYGFENYGVTVTQEEAQKDREGFFEDYPGLRPWHERQRRLARRYHRVNSPIGRVRHLPDILSSDEDVRAESERQAINSPVQSFASDLMLLSLITLHSMLPADQARIVGTVHDSILFEVRDDVVDEWAPVIKSVMEDMSLVKKKFGTEVTVPIVADIETGQHWGETKPWQ
jgi:uracil-DNA glycosylase family 4